LGITPVHGQQPRSGQLDPIETVRRYVGLRFNGARWSDFEAMIVWQDEPGWDSYWLTDRYTVGPAKKAHTSVIVPVTFHRLGLYSHDFMFKPDQRSVTIQYEVVTTSTGWRIKGPEPNPPDLSLNNQIEALLTASHNQSQTPEYRKQAEATAKRLAGLASRKSQ
jgi:hypothetical protein